MKLGHFCLSELVCFLRLNSLIAWKREMKAAEFPKKPRGHHSQAFARKRASYDREVIQIDPG
jgi:hypothetical protein